MTMGAIFAVGMSCILAMGGCAPSRSVPSASRAIVIEPPPPPVLYDRQLSLDPLTDEQLREIVEEAVPQTPQRHEIWYVHVHNNRVFKGERHWNVTVFYTPSVVTRRTRRGQSFHLRDNYRRVREKITREVGDDSWLKEIKLLDDYVQISLPDAPFGESLELPTYRLWPFRSPEGFTDDELIELVDFARDSPRVPRRIIEERPGQVAVTGGGQFNGQEPIYRIRRLDDGMVEVWSGSQQDNVAGSGSFMKCVKKDGVWLVVTAGWWVS